MHTARTCNHPLLPDQLRLYLFVYREIRDCGGEGKGEGDHQSAPEGDEPRFRHPHLVIRIPTYIFLSRMVSCVKSNKIKFIR